MNVYGNSVECVQEYMNVCVGVAREGLAAVTASCTVKCVRSE